MEVCCLHKGKLTGLQSVKVQVNVFLCAELRNIAIYRVHLHRLACQKFKTDQILYMEVYGPGHMCPPCTIDPSLINEVAS